VGEGGPMTGYVPAGAELNETDRQVIRQLTAPETVKAKEEVTGADYAASVEVESVSGLDPANIMCTLLTLDGDTYRSTYRGPGGRPLPEIDDYYAEARWHRLAPDEFAEALPLSR